MGLLAHRPMITIMNGKIAYRPINTIKLWVPIFKNFYGLTEVHNLRIGLLMKLLVVYMPLFCFTQPSWLVRAYLVHVRPLLEYNCVIWSPWLKQDIDKIERVQRRFTKRLPGCKCLSYSKRLLQLNLTSLELRRYADLVMYYKLIFGHVECKLGDFFTLNSSAVTRGHIYKLYKNLSKNSVRKFFFSERVINIWNFLPADTVNFTSLSSFRRTIGLDLLDVDF